MIVARLDTISRHYGLDPVFADLTAEIRTGERIGLVGPNGAGKTTLVKVLAGIDPPDTGQFLRGANVDVELLRQFPDFPEGQTLIAEAKRAMSHLIAWREAMIEAGEKMAAASDDAERARWSKRYEEHAELLHRHGGFEFDHRIEEVLGGLGFSPRDFGRELSTFSGGQQSRVMLAKLLLRAPDLFLLDEPTNHLDIDTTAWLEDYLVRQEAAMIVVSHDRYFLDKVVTRVWELRDGRLTSYPGAYRAYVRQSEEQAKVEERIATKQREEIAKHEEFIRRNAYGQLAKQAKSREKMLERVKENLVEARSVLRGPAMSFGKATRTGDVAIAARGLAKSFGPVRLFSDVDLSIERGERVGIIGANGTGKTTLLRILLGDEPASAGEVKLGANIRLGYLDQELTLLDPASTPLEAIRPAWKGAEKEETFRAALARFGIYADLAENRIGALSGGERTRVALARLATHEVNLLALDEPTNHLDLWACESLESALADFDGTVVVVSHDRYFLNKAIERLLWIVDGKVRSIPGNFDRYWEVREAERLAASTEGKEKKAKAVEPAAAAKKKRKFPFRKTADIEADIAKTETSIAKLEADLLTPEVYTDGRKSHEVGQELKRLKESLDRLLEHWEEAVELNPSS